MIYGYIRVSTEKQTVEVQRYEINRYCRENGIEVDAWIEESISGAIKPSARLLGKLILDRIKKGDLILVTEISRLGRNVYMVSDVNYKSLYVNWSCYLTYLERGNNKRRFPVRI